MGWDAHTNPLMRTTSQSARACQFTQYYSAQCTHQTPRSNHTWEASLSTYLTVGEPCIDSQLLWADHTHFKLKVTEGSLEFAPWADDDNMSLADRAGCAFDNVEEVGGQDSLHGDSAKDGGE